MSQDALPQESPPRLQLRPGSQLFTLSSDELQIVGVNHTTTFTSVPVVRVVEAAVEVLRAAPTRASIGAAVAERTGEAPPLVEYIIELMLRTGCVVTRSAADPGAPLDPRAEFYAAVGIDPDDAARTLAAARPLAVTPAASAPVLLATLDDLGVSAEVVALAEGSSCGQAIERLRAALESTRGPLLCWDVPYRSALTRQVNELAIERDRPVLFAVCEGAVGRIGPYVLPRNTACLECLHARLASNQSEADGRATTAYRARDVDRVPGPAPGHPAFRRAIAGLCGVELSQILLTLPPTTLGGYVEYIYASVGAVRHPTLKVPRCPACHPARPQRLAWNARFPAPLVKSGAA